MKLSFIIPVLNEAENIEQLYKEIIVETTGYDYEIIFIDDGSTDESYNLLLKLADSDQKVKISLSRVAQSSM